MNQRILPMPSNLRTAVHTVREHGELQVCESLSRKDHADLEAIHRELTSEASQGAAQWVFTRNRNGRLAAGNFVGIITTKRGRTIEILPKIDLGYVADDEHESTRQRFLEMLRWHRGLANAAKLPQSGIRGQRRFSMLDVFVLQFLKALNVLVRGGLARRYRSTEENLPHLRGRVLFREHIRENLVNQARFYVSHDELSVNRPANRLIRSALARLAALVRGAHARQLLQELTAAFDTVPHSTNPQEDWRRHKVDRSMRHYEPVMQWVGLFLFNQGLTTFAGRYVNVSLLFPMEKVFEDFVTHSFIRYQDEFKLTRQGPERYLASHNGKGAFKTKPDMSLMDGSRSVVFILDAKWKELDASRPDKNYGIAQSDLYQLYAYGKRYQCRKLALVYPQTRKFKIPLPPYRLVDELTLLCLPFDVTSPKKSVQESIKRLRERA